MIKKQIVLILSVLFLGFTFAFADTVKLKADHPERHIVVKGDTLWDISAHFLKDPWLWPEIWHINPEIENPHLIYPGDIIVLTFVDGKPVLTIDRGRPTIKLGPTAHASRLDKAITTIPLDAIKQFLKRPRVLTDADIEAAAYVVASEEGRLISGTETKIYARGIKNTDARQFNIYRLGRSYRNEDAKKDDILGYEAIHVGQATLLKTGDPSSLTINNANRETRIGDFLFPVSKSELLNQHFIPRPPESPIESEIIAVLDGVSHVGQYQIVVLNAGLKQNVKAGHVLAIYQTGRTVKDTVDPDQGETITLPDERAGTLMIIKPYRKVSYALIMEAFKDIRVYDKTRNP